MALNGRDFRKGPWVETPGDQLLPVLPADAKVTKVAVLVLGCFETNLDSQHQQEQQTYVRLSNIM